MLVTDLLKGLSPEPMLLEVEWVRDRASRVMLADGTVTKDHAVRRRSLVKRRHSTRYSKDFTFPSPPKRVPRVT